MKENNVVLVCLDLDFAKNVSAALAAMLDMNFTDLKDYIEYELLDSGAILENCGLQYLKKREKSALKSALVFENTILTCNFNILKEYSSLFNKNVVCYLALPEKDINKKYVTDRLAFVSHDEFLKNYCEIVSPLKSKNINVAVKKTAEAIGGYYENK